jgi:tripartite-type tricarboxylate transporter receptor subunit TctC
MRRTDPQNEKGTTMINRRRLLRGFGAGALALSAGPMRAQSFPTRVVRVITPFPAGSGPDAALRLVADRLGKTWGKPVVIDNRPGGNGFIAVAAFKQGATDGHELIQLDSTHVTTHPHTYGKLPYDVERDLAPIRMMLRTPFFVTVAADSPYRTLDDIIAAAKARPGRITYGSWFNGSPGHIGALRLQSMKGLQMTHIPFRDFGQLYAAVAGKEVDWALGSIASAGGLERAGKIRFIVVAAAERDPLYPNVPCTAESAGTRGYEVSAWAGLFAPPAAPAAVRSRISADMAEALAAPEVVERYRAIGFEIPAVGDQAFAELIRKETLAWGEIIRAENLRLD